MMEYVLKSAAVLFLFYACYKVFLQRETFFEGNRWFLLLGLFASILVPLVVIPIYVEYTPVTSQNFVIASTALSDTSVVSSKQNENNFDLLKMLGIIYKIGVIFFMCKLLFEFSSLFFLIKRNKSFREETIKYILAETDIAPFSFFNWIVYNPNQFNREELLLVLNHEKVHVKQYHSLDVILSQICCAIFWFNPIMWLYKKDLQQNLEFISDRQTQINSPCESGYQNLLLKTSISNYQLALTNNFYNSLIKKRIVMLNKSKSNKMNAYKYALVLPLLVLFLFNFNTEVIAQSSKPQKEDVKIGQNILKYIVTKDTKDTQLESIKQKMSDQSVTFEFKNLKRNDKKEITAIRIEYTSEKGSGEYFVNSDDPIKDIAINLNMNEEKLTVGQATKNLSQSFEIITEDGDKKVKTSGTGNNVFVYTSDDNGTDNNKEETIIVVGKDGEEHEVKQKKNVYVIKSATTKTSSNTDDEVIFLKKHKNDTVWVKKDTKNIIWTDDQGKKVEIIGTENGDENYKIYTNGNDKPLIILDGEEVDNTYLKKIEPNSIDNITVLKGDKAIDKYGKKGKDGVIEIISKNSNSNAWSIGTVKVETYEDGRELQGNYSTAYISKTTTDDLLEVHKKQLKSEGVTFDYSKLKRNKSGEIVRIKVDLSTGKGKSKSGTFTNDDGISQISMGIKGDQLFLNSSD